MQMISSLWGGLREVTSDTLFKNPKKSHEISNNDRLSTRRSTVMHLSNPVYPLPVASINALSRINAILFSVHITWRVLV
jgi:hypothetical protein